MKVSNYILESISKDPTIKSILEAQQKELDNISFGIDDLINQCFIDTATWGLNFWEEDLAIPIIISDSYEVRRARIKAKLQSHGTFTKREALNLANQFCGDNSAILTEMNKQFKFKTTFNIDELISLGDMFRAFLTVKPAHLIHLIGLSSSIDMGISKSTNIFNFHLLSAIEGMGMTQTSESLRFRLKAHNFMSTPYQVENPNKAYLNGGLLLDGSTTLNGLNPFGDSLYLRGDKLTITIHKEGMPDIIFEV